MLGSRAQMCLHPKVSKMGGGQANFACRGLVHHRQCAWHNKQRLERVVQDILAPSAPLPPGNGDGGGGGAGRPGFGGGGGSGGGAFGLGGGGRPAPQQQQQQQQFPGAGAGGAAAAASAASGAALQGPGPAPFEPPDIEDLLRVGRAASVSEGGWWMVIGGWWMVVDGGGKMMCSVLPTTSRIAAPPLLPPCPQQHQQQTNHNNTNNNDTTTTTKVCPYFLSRDLVPHCDVVFAPYNYLLDAGAARNLDGLRWENSVVILDEAHNVQDACKGAASFDLTAQQRAAAIADLDRAVELCERRLARGEGGGLFDEGGASASDLKARLEMGRGVLLGEECFFEFV